MSSPRPSPNARSVLFIDVDGTLVRGASSAAFLAERLGHADQVAQAEAAWDAGLVTARHAEEQDARGWAGTTEAQVREWLAGFPSWTGSATSSAGARITGSCLPWRPSPGVRSAATCARPFGFQDCCGPTLEVRDGTFTGAVLGSCDEHGKRDFAREVARLHGLALGRCAAIGDSRSDLPLFGEAASPSPLTPTAVPVHLPTRRSTATTSGTPVLERWLGASCEPTARTSAAQLC